MNFNENLSPRDKLLRTHLRYQINNQVILLLVVQRLHNHQHVLQQLMQLRDEDGHPRLDELDDLVSLEAIEERVFGEDLRELEEERAADGDLAEALLEDLAEGSGVALQVVRVEHDDHAVETAVDVHEDVDDDLLQLDEPQILLARPNHLVERRNRCAELQQVFQLGLAQVMRQRLAVQPMENRHQSVLSQIEQHRDGGERG